MKTNNEKVLNQFIGIIGEMNERLAELTNYVDEHMGYDPNEVNYGHVGTASHMLEKLTTLTDMAFKRGEYTE